MESLALNRAFWRDRRVFVTGHTGFKGAWLCVALKHLGAVVSGYSLDPPSDPSLFVDAGVEELCNHHTHGDINDIETLKAALTKSEPDVVLHLAAQSLVRVGYSEPLLTLKDNVVGTAAVLEAMRSVPSARAAVVITTDKCYENHEWVHPYREGDALGGDDLYSASKACAEIVTHAYRTSFYNGSGPRCRIASARAGNVIGGGDWAQDRLVPDCIRAFSRGEPVRLRYPQSVRPWQHVLEPLSGYLLLTEALMGPDAPAFCEGWNFGPDPSGEATVHAVTTGLASAWSNGATIEIEPGVPPLKEAKLLRLDSTKARVALGWRPVWGYEEGLARTVEWYRRRANGEDARTLCLGQIVDYLGSA